MDTKKFSEATKELKAAIRNYLAERRKIEQDGRYSPSFKAERIQQLETDLSARVADIQNSLRAFAKAELDRVRKKAEQPIDYGKLTYYRLLAKEELSGLTEQEILDLVQAAASSLKPTDYVQELIGQAKIALRKSSLLPALEDIRKQTLTPEQAAKEKLEEAYPAITARIEGLPGLVEHVKERIVNEARLTPEAEEFALTMLDGLFAGLDQAVAE